MKITQFIIKSISRRSSLGQHWGWLLYGIKFLVGRLIWMSSSALSFSIVIGPSMTNVAAPLSKVVMKHVRCIQLEKDNYYKWEAQFSTMLWGFDLMDYVEGSVDLTSPIARQ